MSLGTSATTIVSRLSSIVFFIGISGLAPVASVTDITAETYNA